MKKTTLKIKFFLLISIIITLFIIFIILSGAIYSSITKNRVHIVKFNQIQFDYLDIRQAQQNFFINYPEDDLFFKTGKNQYIRQNQTKYGPGRRESCTFWS